MGIFKFKQFEVDQRNCAMKINTDGVLLAVLAEHENPESILDIGTGTGVIALMLAQRFSKAEVHAVEIDNQAAATAARNFANSVFSKQLSVSNIAIEQYNSPAIFDLIVSNPPYFVNDLKNNDVKKTIARHADDGFFKNLLAKGFELLNETGTFWFILPVKQADEMIDVGFTLGLHVQEQVFIHSDETKPIIRKVVCLTKQKMDAPRASHFYIYQKEKVYTEAYQNLLKDFFLGY